MKKFLLILCSAILLTGCSEKNIESSTSEIVSESTTEVVTETATSDIYGKQTYREVLEDIYYNQKFPQCDEPLENYDWDISGNEFAIYDIDNDDSDELIVMFTETAVAGMLGLVYDHNSDGNIVVELMAFPAMRFYDNGIIEVDISHNQGPSGDFWPYSLYQYDSKSDLYIKVATVWSLGRDVIEEQNEVAEKAGREPYWEYPYKADTSNSGIVYNIMLSDAEYSDEYVDVTKYNEWHEQYVGGAEMLELPFMKLTEENIKKISGNSLNVTENSDNIEFYDLTLPENSGYLEYLTEFSYGNTYEMSDYGKISEEDGNIYLESISRERTALIDLPVKSETVYVTISCIIDESRFAYNIIQEDASLGCGVYNLANGDDYRIESEKRCHYFPKKVSGDYLILERGFIADTYGYSRLNLKTYVLTDIDLDFIENKHYRSNTAFSHDMKMTANISCDDKGKYTATLFSLENEEVIEKYSISSENNYINFDLEFVSDNQLYIYALKEGDSKFNYLYVINLPVIEITDNIKLYDLTLSENTEYRPKNLVVGRSYEMSGYGTIKEKGNGIILETISREQKELISTDEYEGFVYADIKCKIDDSRFVYRITAEESTIECGIYNLETDEKFRIENNTEYTMNYPYNPQYVAGNYLILYKGWIYSGRNFSYSRLNLDTLEISDVDSEYISQEDRYPEIAFSPDGKTGAVFSGKNKNDEYVITLFSLDDDTKVAEYKFSSENEYTSFDLEFVSEYQLYVYAYEKDDVGSNYLYAIDIPVIPELNDWQKAYKQALFDFMDSDEYFLGNNIIEHSAFSLYDLNTDGTPELIISEDTSHAAGCHIYTYDNGLIYLGKYGAYGDIGYYEDMGIISSWNMGQGIEHNGFFRLENNEINIIAKFYNDVGYIGKEQATFKFNDTEITEDEYNAKLAEYSGIEYVSLGRDYSFNKIDTALTEYSRVISVSRASELLWLNLPEADNRHISYYNRQEFDDRTYYVFRSYEDYDDRRVTTGWYAVDIFTGDCYNTNTLTELTPLINKEKNFSYKITNSGGIEIYLDNKLYQSLDAEIDDALLNRKSQDLVKFRDYDFDGYNDMAVTKAFATNMVCSYFRYNPETEYYEKWEALDNLYFYVTINNDKTLSVHAKSSAVDADDTVYKWSGDVLVPVSMQKRYWNSEGIFVDYFEYDSNGNETLVKREKYIFDENGDVTDTIDVTP